MAADYLVPKPDNPGVQDTDTEESVKRPVGSGAAVSEAVSMISVRAEIAAVTIFGRNNRTRLYHYCDSTEYSGQSRHRDTIHR